MYVLDCTVVDITIQFALVALPLMWSALLQ